MSQLFSQLTTPYWPLLVLALGMLFGAMRVKPIWQRNTVNIKGDVHGSVSVSNNAQTPAAKGSGGDASAGKWLSFLADVLQVIGFAITVMQLAGLAKS